ncbi:serine hydrolase domain-containing protein [Confluentibacter sediminis]|uniref:serine hydrolase domain-containing protein n=1 Tax=Confluentibacter sediminis TaxID=2219045 RepID=UPI000DAE3F45|nr:serine hydrolase domain-containing protein [Confluentibacter sediminis]
MKASKSIVKIREFTCVFFLVFSAIGCCQELENLLEYKGGKVHVQPSIEIFPDEAIYKSTSLSNKELENNLSENIQNIISKQDIVGISITMLIPEQGLWQFDSGYVSKEKNTLVDSSSVFYWASVSKLVTSTVIHQLILEDKLQPTDKLSKWFPQFKDSKKITIKHLLNHTSGIFSFNSDSTFHYQNKFHTPKELLEVALKKRNLFKPGEYWSYTNTGYLLLALIAEHIEGKSFSQIVHERIALPQNLAAMDVLKQDEKPENLALAHIKDSVVNTHFAMPLGAGNMVSNSKDMAVFLASLLTGKYLPIKMVHNMLLELYPMFNKGQYYGSGIMLYDFKEINNTQNQWIGHSGGTENYKAILVYDIKTKTVCAITVNQNISVEAIAFSMIDKLNE